MYGASMEGINKLRRELTWSMMEPDVIWLIFDLGTQYFNTHSFTLKTWGQSQHSQHMPLRGITSAKNL